MHFSESAKSEMKKLGTTLCVLYTSLAQAAAGRREKAWKVQPKLHLFAHLTEWQVEEWGNPRFYSTYADGSLVGLPCEVAESCHPATLAPSALFKWLHVYYERTRSSWHHT